jgi:pyruvate formate lyase activating enzyme
MTGHEAAFYDRTDEGTVHCLLCPHRCVIRKGKYGICGVRRNNDGTLITEIYGLHTAVAMDPIEKKPLYHFHPGSSILSIGTRGCNMKCPYCQNWNISQDTSAHASCYSSADIINHALREGSVGVAYTYSEPIIWYEYVMDTAILAHEKKLANVMVTNGYINRDPLEKLLPHIDAMNIDLKSFSEETYRTVQKAGLADVLATIRLAHERGCHVEVTTLVVPGVNDSPEELNDIIEFLVSVDRRIPWHISRYYPNYKYGRPATDVKFLTDLHAEASRRLDFVYCGNVPDSAGGHDTICPSCHRTVIRRHGYSTHIEKLKGGICSSCGYDLGIIR